MKKIKETKGVTLIALVVTIVVLLILASIGINSGQDAINSAKFNEFKSELKIMQTKVNELNQSNETEIRPELTGTSFPSIFISCSFILLAEANQRCS